MRSSGQNRPHLTAPDAVSARPLIQHRGEQLLASDAANMVTGAEYEVTAGDSAKDI